MKHLDYVVLHSWAIHLETSEAGQRTRRQQHPFQPQKSQGVEELPRADPGWCAPLACWGPSQAGTSAGPCA